MFSLLSMPALSAPVFMFRPGYEAGKLLQAAPLGSFVSRVLESNCEAQQHHHCISAFDVQYWSGGMKHVWE